MNIFWLSLGLFIIGIVEYAIDQYQTIISSRLHFWSTMAFQLFNKLFDFIVNIYVVGTVLYFWEQFKQGNHNFKMLLPYFLYVLGTVLGTGIALGVYKKNKKKQDRDRAVSILANSKSTRKKKGHKRSRKTSAVEVGHLFDSVEASDIKDEVRAAAIEKSSDIIAEKIEDALNQ